MAELLSSLKDRFSCRQYANEPVADDELELVLEAGRIAPSAFGMEPWRFVVVKSPTAKQKIADACYGQPAATSAPVMIALVARIGALAPGSAFAEARLKAEAGGKPPSEELREAYRWFYAQIEPRNWAVGQCNFAAAQMMVQATALGLATCPMGGFDNKALARALGLDHREMPALVLALGHCAHKQGERRRQSRQELVQVV